MEKLKYGLIGCGRIAPNHLTAAFANENMLDITSVCDLDEKKMDAVLAMMPQRQQERVRKYTNYKELLSIEAPQLMAIATESGKHAKIGLDCINAGCNLIVEKPLALSLQDADMLIAAASANGVKLCACHQNRFNKSIQKIRGAVEAGRFGKMLHGAAHIRWNREQDYYLQAPWRGTWEQDGGALMNQCIHNIDLLRWMMGNDVEEVIAYTANQKHALIEAEDLGIALVKFRNGAYGIIEGTTNVYRRSLEETLYLFGENGTVKAGGKSVNIIEEWDFAEEKEDAEQVKKMFCENPPNVYGFGHTQLYADMIDAIIRDRDPYVDGAAGKRALELVLAIYLAAAEGRAVKLPLKSAATTDFKER